MQDRNMELGAIGAVLLEPLRMIPVVQGRDVRSRDFVQEKAVIAWEVMLDMARDGRSIDMLTVADVAGKRREGDWWGFFEECIAQCQTSAHGEYYLERVLEQSVVRRIRACCEKIVADSLVVEGDARAWGDEQLQNLKTEIFDGLVTNDEPLEETVDRVVEALTTPTEKEPGWRVRLPWNDLNMLLGGLQPGVTILAGRPSAGKTTLEDEISNYVASQGMHVGRVTLDGTRDELLARALSRKGGVSLAKLTAGFGRLDQKARVRDEGEVLKRYPFHFEDRRRDLRGICARIREWHREFGLSLVTLDFMQLVTVDERRFQWSKNEAVGYVSQTLKALSLELQVPFLVLSQLSRSVEQEGREPRMSDLRDSGEIEQDAHKVMFVWIDQKARKRMEEMTPGWTKQIRPCWVGVVKNKDGETGLQPMIMRAPYFRFDEAGADFETLLDNGHMPGGE